MPFTGLTFAYTSPTSEKVAVSCQVVQSASWDQIHTDLATAITNVYTTVEASMSVLNALVVTNDTSVNNTLTSVQSQMTSLITLRNFLADNGSFEVWQRGAGASATFTVTSSTAFQYTADRWYADTNVLATTTQSCVISAQAGLSNPSKLSGRFQRNVNQTATTPLIFAYPFDATEINRMLGLKVSFSMLAATGANWSPTSGTFSVILYLGTGAVGRRNVSAYSTETQAFNISTNLAAGSGATAITGSSAAIIPTTTTQAELQITWTPTGTAGANDYITFDDVQLEGINYTGVWSPTAYDRLPQQIELLLCKRFFQKSFDYGVAPAQSTSSLVGAFSSLAAVVSQALNFFWQFQPEMRVAPTITTYDPTAASANWEAFSLGVDSASVAVLITASRTGTKGVTIQSTVSGPPAAGNICYIHAAADSAI